MALTTAQLAYAVRLTADAALAPDAALAAELDRHKAIADAYIAEYAPNAPTDVKDGATILFVGYMYDGPQVQPGGIVLTYPVAWRNSGAQGLLARWRVRRAGVIGSGGAAGATAGLDQAAVDRRIRALVADWAEQGNTEDIPLDKLGHAPGTGGGGLSAAQRIALDGAAQVDSFEINGRDLSLSSEGGGSATLDLPGISVQDEGQQLGTVNTVDEINFRGAGVTVTRTGVRVDVEVPGGGGGGGLDAAQVDAAIKANEDVVGLREFEAALRTARDVLTAVNVTIQNGAATLGVPIMGTPEVPGADPDRELVLTTAPGGALRFDLSALLAKPAVAHAATLSSSNAVVFTAGGVEYFLARSTDSPSQFLFSADTAGTYNVAITESSIDLSPWARRSNADTIPVAKLPNIPSAKLPPAARLPGVQVLSDGGTDGGLSIADLTTQRFGVSQSLGLDLDDHPRGEFHIRINFTITARNSTLLGFSPSGSLSAPADDTTSLDGLAFASDVAALPALAQQTNAAQRHEVGGAIAVYGGDVEAIGRIHVYLAHDANNVAAFFLRWAPGEQDTGNITVGIVSHVTFLPSDSAAAQGAVNHVGPLIATIDIPTSTPGLGLIPATWVIAPDAPAGFSVTGRPQGQLNAPRQLPVGMQGIVLRASVGATVTSELYLPWSPFVADDGRFTGNIQRTYYGIAFSVAAPRRMLRFLIQREFLITSDVLGVYGNQDAIQANSKLEIMQWV